MPFQPDVAHATLKHAALKHAALKQRPNDQKPITKNQQPESNDQKATKRQTNTQASYPGGLQPASGKCFCNLLIVTFTVGGSSDIIMLTRHHLQTCFASSRTSKAVLL